MTVSFSPKASEPKGMLRGAKTGATQDRVGLPRAVGLQDPLPAEDVVSMSYSVSRAVLVTAEQTLKCCDSGIEHLCVCSPARGTAP